MNSCGSSKVSVEQRIMLEYLYLKNFNNISRGNVILLICCFAIIVLNWICLVVVFSRKSTMLTTYSFIVYPCNGPKLWFLLQTPVMLPPVMRRAPGKPKKARNKRNDESTKRSNLARQWKSIVCKKCRKIGHNKRTCKGKTSIDRSIPKGGNKVIWLE